jgi:hypothetical protein
MAPAASKGTYPMTDTTNPARVLRHGDRVRLATWAAPYDRTTVEVGTVRGYATEYRKDPAEAYARARKNGHEIAWTLHAGTALTDSKAFYAAQRKIEDENLARAVILAPGDTVQIDGEQFVVLVPPGNTNGVRNSDPIKFQPLPGGEG